MSNSTSPKSASPTAHYRPETRLVHAGSDTIERRDRAFLRRIRFQLVGGNQSVVGDPYGSRHLEEGPFGRFTFLSVPVKL